MLGFAGQSKPPIADSLSNFPALPQTSSSLQPGHQTSVCSPAKPSTPERRPEQASSRKFSELRHPYSRSLLAPVQQSDPIAKDSIAHNLLQVHTWATKDLVQVCFFMCVNYL